MSDLLARAGAFFLTPEEARPRAVHAPPAVALAAVVAAPRDARGVAGGLAAALRRAAHARTAVVCCHATDGAEARGSGGRPALPAAVRLARRLTSRDLPATAAGSLVHVGLPTVAEDAIRDAWRVLAAAGDTPVVVAVTERTDELDAFLAQADRVFLATADTGAYADLALQSLTRLGPPAARVRPPTGPVARRLAALGLLALDAQEAPA